MAKQNTCWKQASCNTLLIKIATMVIGAVAAVIVLFPSSNAYAIEVSGRCGTCEWAINDDGVLSVGPGTLASNFPVDSKFWPWYPYRESITKAEFDNNVKLRGSLGYLFYGCSALTDIDVSSWDTSLVNNMTNMFHGCSSLTAFNASSWNTSFVTDISSIFGSCNSLSTINISDWDTSSVLDMSSAFSGCISLTTIDISNWNLSSTTDVSLMFCGCSSLSSIDIAKWDTSSVVDMASLFDGCSSLVSLDIADWDTSSAEVMCALFWNCSSLSSIDISRWDTSSVSLMWSMFSDCSSLSSLDLSGWNTSSVTDMSCMFYNCTSLSNLNISGWNTSSLDDTTEMFLGCTSLATLDLSNWNTNALEDVDRMFQGCSSLTSLNLSSWNTSRVSIGRYESDQEMYKGCSSLTRWRIGGLYAIKNACMVPPAATESGWWSLRDQRWYTINQIATERSRIADIYTSTEIRHDHAQWDRLAGYNRYDTMATIVSEGFESSEWAVLATGTDYPDALVASSLAGSMGCPVVLTAGREWLSLQARRQLERLGARNVYVMGGNAAVPEGIIKDLHSMGIKTYRVAGSNRQGTSLEAARLLPKPTSVVIATGASFADALSIGPWCYRTSTPILLTGKNGNLNAAQISWLKSCGASSLIVVGGTSAIPDETAESACTALRLATDDAIRLAGNNRYTTSAAIAEWELTQGMSVSNTAVATGETFPDALAGAALCGSKGSVLVLVSEKNTSGVEFALAGRGSQVEKGYIFGGGNAVSASVRNLCELLTSTEV